jgi:hypothetical protein
MTEMIERVARALALCAGGKICGPGQSVASRELGWKGDGEHFAKYVEAHWQEHITAAQFAIEAMREPTAEMLIAARDWSLHKFGKPIGNDAAIGCWQAMLDAAPVSPAHQ